MELHKIEMNTQNQPSATKDKLHIELSPADVSWLINLCNQNKNSGCSSCDKKHITNKDVLSFFNSVLEKWRGARHTSSIIGGKHDN